MTDQRRICIQLPDSIAAALDSLVYIAKRDDRRASRSTVIARLVDDATTITTTTLED